MSAATSPVLPSLVASAIVQALERGWQPEFPGSPFLLDLGADEQG